MTEHLKIENKDDILTLTFARPDKKNALTNAMYGALADAIEGAETDSAVRVVLIRGEGDMFTAGNDVGEFAAFQCANLVGQAQQVGVRRSSRPQGIDRFHAEIDHLMKFFGIAAVGINRGIRAQPDPDAFGQRVLKYFVE